MKKTTNPSKLKRPTQSDRIMARLVSKKLAGHVGENVRMTVHGSQRFMDRFHGDLNGAYINAVKEAIKLIEVQWFKSKVRVERSDVLVVLGRMKGGYEVVTCWDPRYPDPEHRS